MTLSTTLRALREDAATWAAGRHWVPRGALLLLVGYAGVRQFADAEYWSLFEGINLGVHELGHLLFSPLGEWLATAGGTLAEVGAPLVVALGFLRQRDYFAIAVAGIWESTSLSDVAVYMADARAQQLPLVSPGSGDPEHDWYYLLSSVGMLRYDGALASGVRVLAFATLAAAAACGLWLCYRMRSARRPTA